ncbi:MAG: FAD-binding protein [Candidatus Paceibacterota bacterium]|jgi:UDP-N-acetylmuramate dehydrogenase
MNVKEYVDIKNYSTLKIGGQFRYFAEIDNKKELKDVYDFAEQKNIPVFILGGGSNIVFSDGVINVLALKVEIKGFDIINEDDDFVDIKVGAGEIWDEIVEKTIEMNLSGLEALSAIPGTVGATPVQNVGAYGAEVKDTIISVEVFDIKNQTITFLSNEDCKFGYRDSIFKNEAKGKYVITAVTYRLKNIDIDQQDIPSKNRLSLPHPSDSAHAHTYDFYKQYLAGLPVMNYPGVKKYFEDKKIENLTLKQIREAIIEIRKEKLPNPKIIPNVGSFFKNPIVENKIAEDIKEKFPNLRLFPVDEKITKIPAGWLIENAGLKGKSLGNISVYDKNALVLINNGNASKEDLLEAKNEIVKIVKEKFGITLEQEPEIL